MGILNFFRHIRDIWEYSTTGQFGALEIEGDPMLKAKRDPEDLVSTNLYIGKTIDDGTIKCEVVDVHKTNIHVKVLEINWERLGTPIIFCYWGRINWVCGFMDQWYDFDTNGGRCGARCDRLSHAGTDHAITCFLLSRRASCFRYHSSRCCRCDASKWLQKNYLV